MEIELITKHDLQQFKVELLNDLKALMKPSGEVNKEWLKSSEVRKLLKISSATLVTLRVNGTLRYTKLGGMLYYRYSDIVKVLESNLTDSL
jgi:hypothetical protein